MLGLIRGLALGAC